MYRKQLAYFGMVSLKYFLNLDHELSSQLLIMIIVVLGLVKTGAGYFIQQMAEIRVKVNYLLIEIKEQILKMKQPKNVVVTSLRNFRHSYIQQDISRWHLKKQL